MQKKKNSVRMIALAIGAIFVGGSSMMGCGSAPIHAGLISAGPGVWVEEPGSGLSYCIANESGGSARPVCYEAKRADDSHGHIKQETVSHHTDAREMGNELTKESAKETAKEPAKTAKESSKESSKDSGKDSGKGTSKGGGEHD